MQPARIIGAGIIGLGVRGVHSIARIMAESFPQTAFNLTALCDRNPERISEAEHAVRAVYNSHGFEIAPRHYVDGFDLIDDPAVDLVVITSITDSHRQFALSALKSGKKVYCDKPLAHTAEDAVSIVETETKTNNPLIMGFTRRYEASWLKAFELLKEGTIGDLVMLQVRNIIPYHRYLTAWWRRREWSGGALNDKGSHIFDVFNWFSEGRAVSVQGVGGRSVIQPDPQAPKRCSQCNRDCPYRRRLAETFKPAAEDMQMHTGTSWLQENEEKFMDDVCVYTPGSDLYHNGSIQFLYDNGVIASYFYSIFGPEADNQETLELVGSKGRLILNRHTGSIDLVTDYGAAHRTIDCRDEHFSDSHFGADFALVQELRRFCDGEPPTVSARSGMEATRMVMAAFRSMDLHGVLIKLKDIPDASL